jgi:hypothetical protein
MTLNRFSVWNWNPDTHLSKADRPNVPVGEIYRSMDGSGRRSCSDVVGSSMSKGGMHPPGFYCLMNVWGRWVGTEPLVLRLPFYLLGVLSLVALHRLAGQLLADYKFQRWSVLLFSLSPWLMGFSNFLRPYGLAMATVLWSTTALMSWGASPGRTRWAVLFCLLSLLGIFSLYQYAFVLIWQYALLVLLAWKRKSISPPRRLIPVAVSGVAISICYLPWLPSFVVQLSNLADRQWYFSGVLPIGDWPAALLKLFRIFALAEANRTSAALYLRGMFYILSSVAISVWIAGLRHPREPLKPATRSFLLSAPLAPLLVIGSDLLLGNHAFFISKHSFVLLPLLVMAVVGACTRMSNERLGRTILSAWALLLFVASTNVIYSTGTTRNSFESVAHQFSQHDEPSHLIVFSSRYAGYSKPLFLTLRDKGIHNVRVAYGDYRMLNDLIKNAIDDPTIERISLIQFKIVYENESAWSKRILTRAFRDARRRGWDTIAVTPAGFENRNIGSRTISLVRSVRAKFFHM